MVSFIPSTLARYAGNVQETFESLQAAPNTHFQNKVDRLAEQIRAEFAPLVEFNEWLDKQSQGDFYEQFARYLIKLPLRSARNIISSFYQTIATALHLAVHPIQGSYQIAENIRSLLYAIFQPEVWPTIGAGTIGTLAGHSLVMSNPVSLMGFAIGGALIASGISLSTMRAILHSEDGKELETLKETCKAHLQSVPDTIMVGLITGLLLGGMRRATQAAKKPMQIEKPNRPVPIDTKDQFDKVTFKKVDNVAQSWSADWDGLLTSREHISLQQAKDFAAKDPKIDYFFYMNRPMYLGMPPGGELFAPNSAYFFSGEPHWGSAKDFADGYVKA